MLCYAYGHLKQLGDVLDFFPITISAEKKAIQISLLIVIWPPAGFQLH